MSRKISRAASSVQSGRWATSSRSPTTARRASPRPRRPRRSRAARRVRRSTSTSSSPFTYLAAERVDRLLPRRRVAAGAARRCSQAADALDARGTPRSARDALGAAARLARPRRRTTVRPAMRVAALAAEQRARPRRSCSPPAGWRSAAASTSTIPRCWPRRPPPRASRLEECLHAAGDLGRDGADGGGRAAAARPGRRPAARAARRPRCCSAARTAWPRRRRRRRRAACVRGRARRRRRALPGARACRSALRIERMVERVLRFAYGRLGPRYPRGRRSRCPPLAYVVGARRRRAAAALPGHVARGDLRADRRRRGAARAARERARAARRPAARRARPTRGCAATARREPPSAAWRALAGLPLDFLPRAAGSPVLFNVVPISLFVTLRARPHAASGVLHPRRGRGGRPRLRRASCASSGSSCCCARCSATSRATCPTAPSSASARVPLRWKLLVALPAINIVTGVVVSGLSARARQPDARRPRLGRARRRSSSRSRSRSSSRCCSSRSVARAARRAARGDRARVARGDLGVRVPVLSTDETGALAASFNQMVAGLEERERLREAFGAFVDPGVADRVLERGHDRPRGRGGRGHGAVPRHPRLHARSPSALGAREVVARAQRVLRASSCRCSQRHGGHANKFIGDGLLGVFGAPERLPDHADRAVLAALRDRRGRARGATAATCGSASA